LKFITVLLCTQYNYLRLGISEARWKAVLAI
jgi:hypothetical protein